MQTKNRKKNSYISKKSLYPKKVVSCNNIKMKSNSLSNTELTVVILLVSKNGSV